MPYPPNQIGMALLRVVGGGNEAAFEGFEGGKIDVSQPRAGRKASDDVHHHFRVGENRFIVAVGGIVHLPVALPDKQFFQRADVQ